MIPAWSEVARRYDVAETTIEIPPHRFTVSHVRDVNALVDAMTADDFGPDERLPYWSTLWSAASDLARWVAATPPNLRTPTIELGAGLGLVSLAAAARGDQALCTDYEPDALAFAAHNAEQNGLAMAVEQIDYRAWPDHHHRAYAAVLASDVLYEARAVEPVADSLALLLAPGGEAVVGDPGRPYLERFIDALEGRGLAVERLRLDQTTIVRARRPA